MRNYTGFFGSPLSFFETTESTITEAKKFLSAQNTEYVPECVQGHTFLAAYQSQGRGQRGNKWFAKPHACMMYTSIFDIDKFYQQHININHAAQLNIVCANALVHTIRALSDDPVSVHIKWPNDVLIDDKKVSGILTEQKGNIILLSHGVNIKKQDIMQQHKDDNNQFKNVPISLEEIQIHKEILEFFDLYKTYFERELHKDINEIFNFSNEVLWNKGEVVSFSSHDVHTQVKVLSIEEDGGLILENTQGQKIKTYHGSITRV